MPVPPAPARAARPPPHWRWEVEHDGGDTGCGELVLDLALHLRRVAPGRHVLLTARDPGARLDIPAWCAMTHHRLLEAAHPYYWIRRRAEEET